MLVWGMDNNNNVYLKPNIQTSLMDCTYKPIKYKNKIRYTYYKLT